MRINGERFYYETDHLGNTRVVFTPYKDYTWTYGIEFATNYYPYGKILHKYVNGDQEKYQLTGKQRDEETELDYFGARFFDSDIARFESIDALATKYPGFSDYAYCLGNPVKFVDKDGKEPTPAEAARMAAHVYGDKSDDILTGGWIVSNRSFGIQLQDKTGLKSQVYERVKADGTKEYTYATAGTEAEWADIAADVAQPLGASSQYHNAAVNAKRISDELRKTNSELTFTGHSLGGGEAALNALLTDRKAVTFNAAGVSDFTKFAEGTWTTPLKWENKIDAYTMATDPLNNIQDMTPLPDVNGNRHYLLPTDGSSVYNGHVIDNILKSFGIDPRKYSR